MWKLYAQVADRSPGRKAAKASLLFLRAGGGEGLIGVVLICEDLTGGFVGMMALRLNFTGTGHLRLGSVVEHRGILIAGFRSPGRSF